MAWDQINVRPATKEHAEQLRDNWELSSVDAALRQVFDLAGHPVPEQKQGGDTNART